MPRKDYWDSPLDVPAKGLVENDLTCHGLLGRTLREALMELATTTDEPSNTARPSPDAMKGDDNASDADALLPLNPAPPILNPDSIPLILTSLGQAISDTQAVRARAESPVAALVRGRMHHFNRRGGKWRFVVEAVDVRRRHPLHRDRRKRKGPSLWKVSEGKEPAACLGNVKMEVLAYNDKE